jgi:SAM-dependent methyltransferase
MTTIDDRPAVDPDKLMSFVFQAIDEVGATLNCALVVMGDQLGYYRALAEHGPMGSAELAERTQTGQKYAQEWLNAQAAGNYVTYDPATMTYTLPPEQAVALTDASSPVYLPGFYQLALGTVRDTPAVLDAARTGDGVGWHEHNDSVHLGCERFFRTMYNGHLIAEWLPALDGVVEKLQRGATVADIGCGHGASTILMAQAFPRSTYAGSDYHPASIRIAQDRAAAAGVGDRVTFETAGSTDYPGRGYDFVTTFDALHDMGDPVGAARHVYDTLDDDGTWMIVEPIAGDRVEDNLNPVGRAYYGFSTLLCTPASLSQDVGLALGTQAGPARIRDVATAAGFGRFRIAAQTPFNNVLEVRK